MVRDSNHCKESIERGCMKENREEKRHNSGGLGIKHRVGVAASHLEAQFSAIGESSSILPGPRAEASDCVCGTPGSISLKCGSVTPFFALSRSLSLSLDPLKGVSTSIASSSSPAPRSALGDAGLDVDEDTRLLCACASDDGRCKGGSVIGGEPDRETGTERCGKRKCGAPGPARERSSPVLVLRAAAESSLVGAGWSRSEEGEN